MSRTLILPIAMLLATPAFAQEGADKSAQIAAAVAADWPRYDHGGKGHLTEAEFSEWLTGLRAQSGKSGEDPAKLRAWAGQSFVSADSDANRQVSPEELAKFLSSKLK